MSIIDVQACDHTFQRRFLAGWPDKRIGKPEDFSVFLMLFSIIKNNAARGGKVNFCYSKEVKIIFGNITAVELFEIEKVAERHIRIPCALRFIEIQIIIYQERNIILHAQVEGVFERVDGEIIRIIVTGAVQGIVQR